MTEQMSGALNDKGHY